MPGKSFTTEAIVLKRVNVGEMDRIITLLTPTYGKLVCVAKGVRKMNSSQRAFLEPGNYISSLLIETKSMPILTQTRLLDDFSMTKKNLSSMKKLAEILEIVDQLFPEGMEEVELFQQVVEILQLLNSPGTSFTQVQTLLKNMLEQLGYPAMSETPHTSIMEYVSSVAERPMHSYDYLTVKHKA
jgi:DNA repair protein RecO